MGNLARLSWSSNFSTSLFDLGTRSHSLLLNIGSVTLVTQQKWLQTFRSRSRSLPPRAHREHGKLSRRLSHNGSWMPCRAWDTVSPFVVLRQSSSIEGQS